MRHRYRRASLVAALWLASAGTGHTDERDGESLYRVAFGAGYATASEDLTAGNLTLSGVGVAGSVGTGLFVVRNLAFHVEMFGGILIDPSIEIAGATGTLDGGLSRVAVGVGPTYYFMPANLYAALSLGTGLVNVDAGPASGGTDLGFAAELLVSKEWFVSSGWGIGVSAQLLTMALPDENTLQIFGAGVLLSASYSANSRPRPLRYRYQDAEAPPATDALASPPLPASGDAEPWPGPIAPEASVQTPAAPSEVTHAAPATRTHRGRGWAIDVPVEWVEADRAERDELAHLREPTLVGAQFTSISVEARYFPADARAFVATRLVELGASVVRHAERSVAGLPGGEIEWRAAGASPSAAIEHVTADGGAAYVVRCTADAARLQAERERCTRMLTSFRFETPTSPRSPGH